MPILNPNTLEFVSRSTEQTRRLGMRLGILLQPGDVFCLTGDLGAGKTTFVQGVAQGWGSIDPVSSPTFVLVNVYHRPDGAPLYHMDAYRLQSALEAEDLDMEPMFTEGVLLVEWAERIKEALPSGSLWVSMRWLAEEQRGLTFSASGERYTNLLDEFRRRSFGA